MKKNKKMKLEVYLDGSFTTEEHKQLCGINIVIDWKMQFLPRKNDYFDLCNFTNNIPEFARKALWEVIDVEFVNHKKIKIGLMYLD